MMKFVLLCLSFLYLQSAIAQDVNVTGIINFSGNIGSYPIELQLTIPKEKDSISGQYYYLTNKKTDPILLSGLLTDDWISLKESAYNQKSKKYETTGYMKLQPPVEKFSLGRWAKDPKDFPNNGKSLTVDLTLRENLKAFNPFQFTFSVKKKPANYENISKVASSYYSLSSIAIDNGHGTKWSLDGFSEYDLVEKITQLELEDMNFDGYLDLKIPIHLPDMAKGDYGYIYCLYNVKTKKYYRNKQLNEMGIAFFDARIKLVEHYDADGRGNESTRDSKWKNGRLYLIKEMTTYEDNPYTHFTVYKILNGKSVKIKSYKKK